MRRRAIAAALTGAATLTPALARADGYAQVFGGMVLFDSTVTVGGVKLVDQGGDAPMAGLRLGWGHRWPSGLYLGLEAEGFVAAGRSRAVVNGTAYSLNLRGGAGGFVRAGWQMRSGAMFYARGGAQALAIGESWHLVPAVGVGAEVLAAGPWFARADLTYGWNGTEFYQGTIGIGRRF